MNKVKTTQSQSKPIAEEPSKSSSKHAFISEEIIYLFLLLLLIGIVYIIRSKFFDIPFERDEGAYTYYGKMLLEGKIPYKDFYEQKFPGIFYFYSFMVYVFGDTVRQLHIGFTLLNMATIILIFYTVKKIFSSTAAIISASTFAFVSLTPFFCGFTIQSEHGVAFFISLGIFLYVIAYQTKKWYYYLLMGIAMGAAFMTKTSGVFLALWGGLMLIIDFYTSKERNYKNLVKPLFLYSAGGLSVIAVLFLLIYIKGSFKEMLFWAVGISKHYVNQVKFDDGIQGFDIIVHSLKLFSPFIWAHGLLATVLIFNKRINWRLKLFALSLAAFSLMTIVPGYYFYGHYWIQLVPAVSILSGITCHVILAVIKDRFKKRFTFAKYTYLALFAFFTFLHLNKFKSYYFKPNYEKVLRQVYSINPFSEAMEVAKFVNSIAKPEDQLMVIGSEPEVYIYTHKTSPTNHLFFSTIVSNVPQQRQWQEEYAASIEKQSPKYIVYFTNFISLLPQENADRYIVNWAADYITENYNLIGLCEMFPGQRSTYSWKEQVKNLNPRTRQPILVYERKIKAQ